MGRKATLEGRQKRLETIRKSIYNLERDLYESGETELEFIQFIPPEAIEFETRDFEAEITS